MNKYYAVKQGRITGVYDNWKECEEQTRYYPNAIYKGFQTLMEAEEFMGQCEGIQLPIPADAVKIYTDGSYHEGKYSWSFVAYKDSKEIKRDSGWGAKKELSKLHNIAGEMVAVIEAIKWAEKTGIKPVVIYHDCIGLSAWPAGLWKTGNEHTAAYARFVAARKDWVQFIKVKGHDGILGNEIADTLAKEALGL